MLPSIVNQVNYSKHKVHKIQKFVLSFLLFDNLVNLLLDQKDIQTYYRD